MIFVSAGHNSQSKTIKQDPGAVNKDGTKEGDLTILFRDLVKIQLDLLGAKYITDFEEENLAMYLKRIQTGSGSVVVEYHFDAAESPDAKGTTVLVGEDADRLDKAFAKELLDITVAILGTRSRGVISEKESHRGRLGLMREQGTVCLVEIGFITNKDDLEKFRINKIALAKAHADIIVKYEKFIS